MTESWILISGASTGIGRATASLLAANGFRVAAGVRSQNDFDAIAGRNIEPLMLDVTDEHSISGAMERVRQLTGTAGLRAVINNAGIVVPGPVEFVSLPEWRRQFEVNFFGMVALTQASLPLLRQGVESHGAFVPRLLFISSIGGRVGQPVNAPYTCSKFATNALGDGLRLELRRQGIGVTVIEPGAIATAIWGKGDTSAQEFVADHPARRLYSLEIDGLVRAARQAARRAIPAEEAAAVIVRSITAPKAPARVLVGREAKIAAFLRGYLPLSWFDALLMRQFGLSAQHPALPPARSAAALNR